MEGEFVHFFALFSLVPMVTRYVGYGGDGVS